MNYQTKLNEIFKQEIKLEKLNKGLTNDIYLTKVDGIKYVIRIVKDDIDHILDSSYERKVLDIVSKYQLDVKEYYYDINTRLRITYYVDVLEYYQTNDSDKIKRVAKLLKRLHSISPTITNVFDPVKMFEKYYKQIKKPLYDTNKYLDLINKINTINNPKVLCHNDLVSGNLLFSNDLDYLIDYEFAALNDPLFDIMSFFTENDIYDSNLRNEFYQEYFEILDSKTLNELKIYESFHNLLWLTWANLMYELRNDNVYLDIAKNKFYYLEKYYKANQT